MAGRALFCHTGTAGLAESQTLGAPKPLGLPKYQIKEMKYVPGGSVWASRREEKCGGRTARAVLSPPLLTIEMCLSPQPIPTQTLQSIPHLTGTGQGYGKGGC